MPEQPQQDPSGGFRVHRRLPATAERVHAAFVEPSKLEQWFVVPGFHTPADRMRVNARPGGRMDAVMISDADGSEIPFGFEYAEVDPPRRVILRFESPRELVGVPQLARPERRGSISTQRGADARPHRGCDPAGRDLGH